MLYPGSPVIGPNFKARTVDRDGRVETFDVNPNNFYTGHLAGLLEYICCCVLFLFVGVVGLLVCVCVCACLNLCNSFFRAQILCTELFGKRWIVCVSVLCWGQGTGRDGIMGK